MADGEDVRDLVPDDPTIRLLQIEDGFTIGEKRNFGAGHARGVIIAHWDDDDYSAPARLLDQVERMQSSGKAVAGYCSMLFTDGRSWWRYKGVSDYALGTSLCYRKEWWRDHPFPAKQLGEDNAFVGEARRLRQLVSVEAGEMMVASVHSGNTSPRQLSGAMNWRKLASFPGVMGFQP